MSDNRTAEQFKISKNVHPNTDGSPWGWIVLENSPRVRVATWSGDREYKYCQQLIEASQQTASLREENEKLKSWKESMLKIWGPVIDWGQSKEAGLLPGTSISDEVLRRSRAYPTLNKYNDLLIEEKGELQEEVDRLISLLRKVNTAIQHSNMKGTILHSEIKKALSGKESKPS